MATRNLSQAARDMYRAAYPVGPTTGSTLLAQWIRDSTLTIKEIAMKVGCTEASIRGWSGGRRVPTIEFARRLEELASIPIVAWVTRPEAVEK